MEYIASFDCREEFLEFYGAFCDDLPRRSEGRTNKLLEIWAFRRLAYILIHKDLVTFPLSVKYSDRPEYRIMSGDRCIGVEVTSSSDPDFALALKISEARDIGMIEPADFRYVDRNRRKSQPEIEGLIDKSFLDAEPWEGDAPQREWAKRAVRTILGKVAKFKHYPDKESFSDNILLVFDVCPEPVRFVELTDQHVSAILELEEIANTFHYILFFDQEQLWIDTESKRWELIGPRG